MSLLAWTDERWFTLRSGYRDLYNPADALQALEQGDFSLAWEELWENLLHHNDVDTAAYASVPEIVRIAWQLKLADWNAFALIAVIEEARLNNDRNPPIPEWLMDSYERAWIDMATLALQIYPKAEDPFLVNALLSVLAFAKGKRAIGTFAIGLTEEQQDEMLGLKDARPIEIDGAQS
ncbi:hypothetical protein HB779_10730 [Phyllobacterium sp. 628]|uniref:hypothetical protein n=1 Tax=Phyllobacterium sp. 628 TaxID=2718938 RepID=UPI0016622C88|nr:hypothetical protein [Phyllobacterium sp. 628]QND52334.1 hypothetical protein HB779_10730 [Phyllobacterium sp. 628]